MRQVLSVSTVFILFGLLSVHTLSLLDLMSHVHSINLIDNNERPEMSYYYYPEKTNIAQPIIDNTVVEIVKSFKNSSGFYKINGTLENQGMIMLSDIEVIRYYKFPSINDTTTLVCYEQDIVNCQYKSADNQLPSKSLFLMMPSASHETKSRD